MCTLPGRDKQKQLEIQDFATGSSRRRQRVRLGTARQEKLRVWVQDGRAQWEEILEIKLGGERREWAGSFTPVRWSAVSPRALHSACGELVRLRER